MSHTNKVIEVHGITKRYKIYKRPIDRLKEAIHPLGKQYYSPFFAVRDLSFSVSKGEMFAVIGRNGSGKSTLLKLLTGVLTPTRGSVSLRGKVSALLELGVGFNPEFSGIENIYFYGALMGYDRKAMREKISDILAFADIGDYINQPVKMYSSGMFARLAFSVAINVDPDILIVDEALAVGDIAFQSKCYRKFDEFRSANKTIIFVTHDMDTVLKYCSRVLVLDAGEKVAEGSAHDMVDVYKKMMVVHEKSEVPRVELPALNPLDEESWKEKFVINPNHLEYGTLAAKIIDYGLFDEADTPLAVVLHDTLIEVRMKVQFYANIKEPIFAFAIKDLKGNEIAGTNTLFEKVDMPFRRAGSCQTVRFRQALNLASGAYTLSLGCTTYVRDELVVFHRLYDVLLFEIVSFRRFSGVVDLHSELIVE